MNKKKNGQSHWTDIIFHAFSVSAKAFCNACKKTPNPNFAFPTSISVVIKVSFNQYNIYYDKCLADFQSHNRTAVPIIYLYLSLRLPNKCENLNKSCLLLTAQVTGREAMILVIYFAKPGFKLYLCLRACTNSPPNFYRQ